MDYYGFGKAGYYYTRRVYAPLLASFKTLADGSVVLWITNDTLQPFAQPVTLQYGSFGAGKLWEETLEVRVPANTSQPVWRGAAERTPALPDRYLAVRSPLGAFPANRTFFAAIKDLQRTAVEPRVQVSAASEHELRVRVEAPAYVVYFHLLLPDEQALYSDNYFDLAAGESVEVTITSPEVLRPEMLTCAWR